MTRILPEGTKTIKNCRLQEEDMTDKYDKLKKN